MKQLKSDLAALDHKFTAQLAPKKDENDGEEIKPDGQKQDNVKTIDVSTQQSVVAKKDNGSRTYISILLRLCCLSSRFFSC